MIFCNSTQQVPNTILKRIAAMGYTGDKPNQQCRKCKKKVKLVKCSGCNGKGGGLKPSARFAGTPGTTVRTAEETSSTWSNPDGVPVGPLGLSVAQ